MIKRLLGSTALLGALVVAGGGALAYQSSPGLATPTLTVSGQSSFAYWLFGQDRKTRDGLKFSGGNLSINTDPCDECGKGGGYLFTVDDSRLKFDITGKTDPGMDYGFTIIVNADTNATKNIKENYLYFGGSWGRITVGNFDGVEDTMSFYGGDPLGGTGGFDGNFDRVVNFTTGSVRSADLVGDTSKDTKAQYKTPRWKGLQFGVSYAPKTGHRGEAFNKSLVSTRLDKDGLRQVYDRHSTAIGLNFINKFENGLELSLSGTAIFGDAHAPCSKQKFLNINTVQLIGLPGTVNIRNKYHNTRSFAFGFLTTYRGFEWGGEFGLNGDSHEIKKIRFTNAQGVTTSKGPDDSWFLDTGLGYTWGATKLSAGYFFGQRKAVGINVGNIANATLKSEKSRTHIFSVALDHKLAPGVLVFTEFAHYNMKNGSLAYAVDAAIKAASNPGKAAGAPVVRSNKANAWVLGTKIKF